METILLWVLFWLVIGSLVGNLMKRQPVYGAGLALLCGPVGLFLIPLLPDLRTHCPQCRSVVDPQASICKYCQSQLTAS